ncbi:hypothetical protein PRUPE_2G082500 [Prunus persica]|uniref:Uncharacterized protein n=1 Tax=Prunus persica TaxID=3760 RepID=A0A251QD00_PRUPE|nr:hypothetical protein PRUPE_2G082500 [Prunus persica]
MLSSCIVKDFRICSFCICFMCFGVFAVLALIISHGGDVSVFMEATATVLWHLLVFLLLVGSGFIQVLDSNFMLVLRSGFMPVVEFMHV